MSIYSQVKKYTTFTIFGKRVSIPYCIVENNPQTVPTHYAITNKNQYFAGKGTAEQIYISLLDAAHKAQFNLRAASGAQIKSFMITQGIGVDCSGFVYNVINSYLLKAGLLGLDSQILRFGGLKGKVERRILSWNRVRRASADTLTNHLNTVAIKKVSELKSGDLIRLSPLDWTGKHVLVVVEVTESYIFYAHSSANTEQDGPHISWIKILDANEGLEKQEWLELTKSGENYGKRTLLIENGDGARRFKFFK